MQIKNKSIGLDSPVYIIAEAGVNHNGILDLALQLIDLAAESGADAVKFQTYSTPDLIIEAVPKAPYQRATTTKQENQREMLEKLQINKEFHLKLIEYCNLKDITFLSTPYDETSLKLLLELKVAAIKIASTDATNLLFLEEIAKTGLPVILSTGMCSMDEIVQAVTALKHSGCRELALLKCTSDYPTRNEEVNLKSIQTLYRKFNTIIGFSDHTAGVGASPYAVACGAKIIEKHFTLDKKMEGPDHKASLSPQELKKLVKAIREIEKMLGTAEVGPTDSELINKKSLQKYFVARTRIKAGDTVTRKNIIAKRTGGEGIPANSLYDILGKQFIRELQRDEIIFHEDMGTS